MKMAKASEADLKMAMDLTNALESLERYRCFPDALRPDPDDMAGFDEDNADHCREVLEHLLKLVRSASLMRVVFGCAVMLDPENKCVDPDADTIEHHPDALAGLAAKQARPLIEWREEMGDVLWWSFPVDESPWCGQPSDDDWPCYHTHWTPLVVPDEPEQVGVPA